MHGLDWNPQVPSSLEQDKMPLLPLSTLRSAEAGDRWNAGGCQSDQEQSVHGVSEGRNTL
jgi:hypothetical protein